MSTEIWLVTAGSYSDYRVHCAAASEAEAQAIADHVNRTTGTIEYADVEQVHVYAPEEIQPMTQLIVYVQRSGIISHERPEIVWPWDSPPAFRVGEYRTHSIFKGTDHERVRKAARDRAAKWAAAREGL